MTLNIEKLHYTCFLYAGIAEGMAFTQAGAPEAEGSTMSTETSACTDVLLSFLKYSWYCGNLFCISLSTYRHTVFRGTPKSRMNTASVFAHASDTHARTAEQRLASRCLSLVQDVHRTLRDVKSSGLRFLFFGT
jgi:hypothetical protein